MTEEEIKKFAKEYVQNNTDESVNSFIGEQLQKAFIEGTDFMYYSNNEELKKELTEKDKQIAELKKIEEEYYDFIQKKNEEDWKGDNVVGCLKLKIEQLKAQIEKMKCCDNCEHNFDVDGTRSNHCVKCKNFSNWELEE